MWARIKAVSAVQGILLFLCVSGLRCKLLQKDGPHCMACDHAWPDMLQLRCNSSSSSSDLCLPCHRP